MARLLKNERITAADHFQDTRHIEVDLGDSGLAYQPGDLLAVFPQQSASALRDFLHRTRLDPDEWVRIQPAEPAAGTHNVAFQVTYFPILDISQFQSVILRLSALAIAVLQLLCHHWILYTDVNV